MNFWVKENRALFNVSLFMSIIMVFGGSIWGFCSGERTCWIGFVVLFVGSVYVIAVHSIWGCFLNLVENVSILQRDVSQLKGENACSIEAEETKAPNTVSNTSGNRVCPECGAVLVSSGAAFCGKCGKPVPKDRICKKMRQDCPAQLRFLRGMRYRV